MTRDEVAEIMSATFSELQKLREAGQKEYAHHLDNAFANFDRVGQYLNTDRKKVLMTYLLKHIDGITAAIHGHMSQREPVSGRIHDAIVYLILLKAMFIEESRANLAQAQVPERRPGIGDAVGQRRDSHLGGI